MVPMQAAHMAVVLPDYDTLVPLIWEMWAKATFLDITLSNVKVPLRAGIRLQFGVCCFG